MITRYMKELFEVNFQLWLWES